MQIEGRRAGVKRRLSVAQEMSDLVKEVIAETQDLAGAQLTPIIHGLSVEPEAVIVRAGAECGEVSIHGKG